ncbi:MAG: rhomboid family intramembrane serine protease [Pirellulales bacterium]
MRMLGTIDGKANAEKLVAHLLTLDIATQVEAASDGSEHYDIWIRDEDQLSVAKAEFVVFLTNPQDPRYARSLEKAQEILQKKKQAAQVHKPQIYRGVRTQRGLPPVTMVLVILCVGVSLLNNFSKQPQSNLGKTISQQLAFVEPIAYHKAANDGFAQIRQGQVWRLFTPIFMHGDPLHLFFNMILLIQFGRILEMREGSARFGCIVLVIAVLSNVLQASAPEKIWGGTPFFIGISGVNYGLFGFHWIKSTIRPDLLPQLPSFLVIVMLVWLTAGFLGVLEAVRPANLVHLGGLLSGAGLGWLGQSWGGRIAKRSQAN